MKIIEAPGSEIIITCEYQCLYREEVFCDGGDSIPGYDDDSGDNNDALHIPTEKIPSVK